MESWVARGFLRYECYEQLKYVGDNVRSSIVKKIGLLEHSLRGRVSPIVMMICYIEIAPWVAFGRARKKSGIAVLSAEREVRKPYGAAQNSPLSLLN
jgi:hypothetical protein